MNMIRQIQTGMTVLAMAFIASGCVSTGTFDKMQAEKNEEIKALQQQKADLEQQNADTRQQVGTLEQEKAAMLSASQQRQQQYDALVKDLSSEVQKGQLQVKQYQNMLSVDLAEQIFFDSGKATLKPGGKDVLKKVGDALKGYENKIIRVVGHTDNVPVARSLQGTFPTNWELSAGSRRAAGTHGGVGQG
jgi:chemotaxis protein MotB